MKKKIALVVLISALLALGSLPAWSQATLARVTGKITDNGKPIPNAEVIYTSVSNGKVTKTKTDKNGDYFALGFSVGDYKIEIKSATGETLFSINKYLVEIDKDTTVVKNIDVVKDNTGGSGGGIPSMTKEQLDALKASNAKAANINALISQAQNALNAKNWQEAIPPLQQMIEADPKRWEYYQALGNAQYNLAQYQETIATNEKGIAACEAALADPAKGTDPKTEGARVKGAEGQMLALNGNAYIKLQKNDKAVESFEKAAALDPNPAVAYFNLCATQYNVGQMKAAALACDKAVAADPNKADAYFIKGSALYGDGKLDANNKYVVPPGTAEALNKYLELSPDGPHAADVKAMLEALGVPIVTSYGKKKK